MTKRMLIDSSHQEETRVVVLDGSKVEEFDFEAASRRPLKGNIYLAKVTRVEPSLQAAFVEYGGNRQGFLAFSEIHPDYYQIPVADRQALIAEQQEEARRRGDDEFETVATGTAPATDAELEGQDEDPEESEDHSDTDDHAAQSEIESSFDANPIRAGDADAPEGTPIGVLAEAESEDGIVDQQSVAEAAADETETEEVWSNEAADIQDNSAETVETGNLAEGQSEVESAASAESGQRRAQPLRNTRPPQRWVRRRHYKIQEVIKRKQIMLVQVVKEERGTKGAALTTYLSLAGRYSVLMPNTARGGGISRKITNPDDRARLREAAADLEVPEGMGVILRTAGASRTKTEVKRDFEYLLRMWEQVRDLTLKSTAPTLVYRSEE